MARGPGWYSPADLKERLFTNKSKRPRDDLKEALRTGDDTVAWQAWNVAHDLIWQSCRPGPPLVFPGEKELIRAMYDQIGKEEQIISPPYTRTPLDAAMRGRKKRKQGEDDALLGQTMQHGFMLRTWEHDMPIGGLMIRQGRASNQWLYSLETSFMWPTVLEEGCFALTDTLSFTVEGG